MKQSGIYKISNLRNGKCYIGSTQSLYHRFHVHLSLLRKGKHHSRHLQNSYNKHQEDDFKFEVLAMCPQEYLIKLEQWFMNNIKPEYNILPVAGTTKGRKVTNETREKQSKSRKKLLDSGFIQIGYARPRISYSIYEDDALIFKGKSNEVINKFGGNRSTFYAAASTKSLWMEKYRITKNK